MKVLVNTNDGFEISKADLSMRGFGELSGTKQSGLFDLRFASVVDDYKMFLVANEDAKAIISNPRAPGHGYLLALAKTKVVTRG